MCMNSKVLFETCGPRIVFYDIKIPMSALTIARLLLKEFDPYRTNGITANSDALEVKLAKWVL